MDNNTSTLNDKVSVSQADELSASINKRKKLAEVWDKITTGLLILLMASPFLILLYIFLWFILKN